MPVRSFQKAGSHSLRISSPAKVNLRLEVIARRPDGYHDIRTVMVPIDLSDLLHIRLTEEEETRVSCSRADVPKNESNLAHRAGLLVLEAIGRQKGFHIRIDKRIPVGSGLGGGSSNAASTLLGLNSLLGDPLTRNDLMGLATKLGADVPFFVLGCTALATGIGERLEALDGLPTFWFLLVYPGIRVSTKWAYGRLNLWLTNPRDHINMPPFSWDISNLGRFLQNDLEKVVVQEYPILGWIKQRLLEVGAAASLMSGSGSATYGVFFGREDAERAYQRMREETKEKDWEIFLSRSIG